jgi:hypothetical protein
MLFFLSKKIKIRSIGGKYKIHSPDQYYTKQKLYKGFNALLIINEGLPSNGFYGATKIK